MLESPTKFLKTLDSRDFDELISIKDDLNYLIDELEHEIREPEDFRTEHDLPLKVVYVNALRCMTGLTSHMSLRVNEFIDSWKWGGTAMNAVRAQYCSIIPWRYVRYSSFKNCGCSIITLVPRVANQP